MGSSIINSVHFSRNLITFKLFLFFFFFLLASFYTKPHQFSIMIILIYTGFKSKGIDLINAKLCLDVGYDKYIIVSNFGGFVMSGFEVIVITELSE